MFKRAGIKFSASGRQLSSSAFKSKFSKNKVYAALGVAASVGSYMLYSTSNSHENNISEQLIASSYADQKKATPQTTVISGVNKYGGFATIHLTNTADLAEVASVLSQLPSIVDVINPEKNKKYDEDDLPAIVAGVGFGTKTWAKLCKQNNWKLPEGYGDLKDRYGEYGRLPSTGGDILLHVKAESVSLCWEAIKDVAEKLPRGSVVQIDDWYGFQFKDGRDLSGFLDGTENPSSPEEREEAAVNSNGGSFAIHQRWHHSLDALHTKELTMQEGYIGRKKDWSAELDRNVMPLSSHVARMRSAQFQRIPIVRQSMPFGRVGGEHGLLFLAYSNDTKRFDKMLDRMVGSDEGSDGKHNDAIMRFSQCVKGQYFYIPSLQELASLKK